MGIARYCAFTSIVNICCDLDRDDRSISALCGPPFLNILHACHAGTPHPENTGTYPTRSFAEGPSVFVGQIHPLCSDLYTTVQKPLVVVICHGFVGSDSGLYPRV